MKLPTWVRPYIGIPYTPRGRDFDGVDCWGLFKLVQEREFGIEVPSYADDMAYNSRKDVKRVGEFISQEKDRLDWTPIPLSQGREGDALLFRIDGLPVHIGVIVCRNHVLHVEDGIASVCEEFSGSLWSRRIFTEPNIGQVAYRHGSRF